MEILVDRKYKKEKYTIGMMYVDGKFFCSTLEDKDRGLSQDMPLSEIKKKKVYAETAIPTGTYKVVSYYWEKNKDYYPLLLNVPGYTGIFIHGGSNASHSAGCLLLGENKIKGGLVNSKPYVRKLTELIIEAEHKNEPVTITIK